MLSSPHSKSHPEKQNTDITVENYKGMQMHQFSVFIHFISYNLQNVMAQTPRRQIEKRRTGPWEMAMG